MYNATYWLDRVVDEETEEVIQEGTDQSAGHFNNMEEGISDAHLATALLLISASLSADQVATEEQTITLENSESFPFNNSVETVALKYGPETSRTTPWRPKCWSMTETSET